MSGHRPWREIVRKSQISLAKRVTEQIVTAPTSRLFAWLQYVRPYTAEQAIKQEMPIGRRIGRGVFRDTYALVGHPDLVIKFPTDQSIRIYSDDAGAARQPGRLDYDQSDHARPENDRSVS